MSFRPLFPIVLGLSASLSAQPYSLRPELDLPLAAGLFALKRHSGSMLAETRARPLDLSALDGRDIPAFDRWAIGFYSPSISSASSVVAASALAIPLAANAWDMNTGRQGWSGLLVDFVLLQEAWMLASTASNYAKSRPVHSTPLTYDPDVPESEKRRPQNASSFFSNHTGNTFATAVYSAYTFQLRRPDSRLVPWVWGGGLALAAGVGSMRILAGKHFPSDVVAGAAVGALSGYLIPRLHLGRARPRSEGMGKKPDWELGVGLLQDATPAPMLRVRF